MKHRVWMMKHSGGEDEHGDPYCAPFGTELDAVRAIQKYVTECWAEGKMDDRILPVNPGTALVEYFEEHGDTEWYEITYQDIDFFEQDAPGRDEVDLSQEEVDITYHALGMVSFSALVQKTGFERSTVQGYVRDIREKLDP